MRTESIELQKKKQKKIKKEEERRERVPLRVQFDSAANPLGFACFDRDSYDRKKKEMKKRMDPIKFRKIRMY